MKKNKLISMIRAFMLGLASMFSLNVFADSQYTTVVENSGSGVKFDDLTRLVYSKEIEYHALPNLRFLQFATVKEELGVQAGLTISMLTYNNMKLGGALTEMKHMETQAMSGSTKSITVREYGNALGFSELAVQASFDDVLSSASRLLGRDYALVLDCELRDTALSGTNIVYSNGSARTDITANDTLKVKHIKDAIEILATNNAPKYNGANWICFVHPHQSRDLRDDSAWISATNYGAPEQHFTGEIGRIDDTIFIETTLMCNGEAAVDDPAYNADLVSGTSGNQTNIYQAVIFGDAYYGLAISLPVELRDNGVVDFGRERALAWYSIFGTGLLHNQYGVVIETA